MKIGNHKNRVKATLIPIILLTSCTFGSVGNKIEEDAIIFENLIRLVREIPGTFQPVVHSYDDQINNDLSTFEIVSGATGTNATYHVQIQKEGSFLEIDRFEFRFNPPDKPFGSLSNRDMENQSNMDTYLELEARTHTPFTIPLDLPPNDPYGKTYVSKGSRIQDFMIGNSDGIGNGRVSRNTLQSIADSPQGILSSSNLFIKRWDLRAIVTRQGDNQTRTITISFRDYHQTLLPRCKTELSKGQTTEWIVGFRYSSIYRDFFRSGARVSILNNLFATGSNGDQILISDLHSGYEDFLFNLKSDDLVIVQESCLL
jgi:hypothetical protein